MIAHWNLCGLNKFWCFFFLFRWRATFLIQNGPCKLHSLEFCFSLPLKCSHLMHCTWHWMGWAVRHYQRNAVKIVDFEWKNKIKNVHKMMTFQWWILLNFFSSLGTSRMRRYMDDRREIEFVISLVLKSHI